MFRRIGMSLAVLLIAASAASVACGSAQVGVCMANPAGVRMDY